MINNPDSAGNDQIESVFQIIRKLVKALPKPYTSSLLIVAGLVGNLKLMFTAVYSNNVLVTLLSKKSAKHASSTAYVKNASIYRQAEVTFFL